ncbi:MAG: hypothetical protein IT381_20655 [Deltaproteobacteria bacterium]|nr:hypothetical protein [Deltaproteobacteria bacterium]
MKWLEITRFELRRRLRAYSTWVYAALLFGIGVLFMLAAGGAFESASADFGKVHANAPLPIFFASSALGIVGLFVIASIAGQAFSQDHAVAIDQLFFASPVKRAHYWIGRFVAAEIVLAVLFLGIPAGLFFGAVMPGLDPRYFGPHIASYYMWPYLHVLLPNILGFGGVFFALATLKRSMRPVHFAAIMLVMGYFLAQAIGRDPENDKLVGMLDPFGMRAARVQTRYWPIAEQNERLVELAGVMLWNRVLWVGIGILALVTVALRFRPDVVVSRRERVARAPAVPRVVRTSRAPLWMAAAWLETKQMVLNLYFQAVALAGVVFTAIILSDAGSEPGWRRHLVTSEAASTALDVFSPFGLAIVTIFAGDAVWRERDAKMHQLYDALPMRTWQPFVAKLIGLFSAQALLLCLVALAAMGVQLAHGFYAIEPMIYVERLLLLDLPQAAMLCVLATAASIFAPNKYSGYMIVVVYFLGTMFLDRLGFEHLLYRFGQTPAHVLSDMNGYGHFVPPVVWFTVYWLLGAALLAVLALLGFRRGEEGAWRVRLADARRRFVGRLRVVAALLAALFVLVGAWIFYNTTVLNRYEKASDREKALAEYERTYKIRTLMPQPKITAVEITAHLRPELREADLAAEMTLENKNEKAVDEIDVLISDQVRLEKLEPDRKATRTIEDPVHGYFILRLEKSLQPGEKMTLHYAAAIRNPGFRMRGEMSALVENGTFLGEGGWFPKIGYVEGAELSDDNARHRQGLLDKERVPDLDDASARRFNMFTHDADWIRFAATLSTAPDQIAIAPGYLQREWTENGRRFFRYEMDAPMQNFYNVSSGRYAVHKSDAGGVAVEIFHHPAHTYNIERMAEAVKHSLATFTRLFGPYQFRQLRIIEFPRYASFAQSFPNTVPYSEAMGFIARVDPDDPKDIDYPYFVTAHEVAHQWWGHQVVGGDVQGAAMLCESLAEYSALLVIEEKYGERMMRRFLKRELDDYLRGRAGERKKELPLLRVENQAYIHYHKGALAFYALADRIGKDRVNAALRRFVEKTKFQQPPYTYTRELMAELRQETPTDLQGLVDDLFEKIVLFDNRTTSAVAKQREDGAYEVTLEVTASKNEADESGRETSVPFAQLIEIGGVDEHERVTAVEVVRMMAGPQKFSFVSKTLPKKAGVDPLNKLVDRVASDNLVKVNVD